MYQSERFLNTFEPHFPHLQNGDVNADIHGIAVGMGGAHTQSRSLSGRRVGGVWVMILPFLLTGYVSWTRPPVLCILVVHLQ